MVSTNNSCLIPMNFEIPPQQTAGEKKAVSGHPPCETKEEIAPVIAKKGVRHFAAPLSSAELERAGPVKTEWLWGGYLAPGSVTLLTSLWKSGKSTLIAVLLEQMKEGGKLAGLALRAGRAVVISEEPASLWARRNRLLGFGPHLSWYCQPFFGQPRMEDWQLLLAEIGRMHEQQKIDLLVIDSLAKLAPLSRENDAGEMLKALEPLERLAQAGMSVLILHHPRKGKYRPGQAARGSGALLAFVDIFIEMERVSRRNPKDRRRRLLAFSRYSETPTKWVIELTEDGVDYVSLGPSGEPEFDKGWPVMKSILERAEGRLTWRQIVQRWPQELPRPAKTTMSRWLDQMLQERQILREGRGTKHDPYVYLLPGMEIRWQDDMLRGLVRGWQAGTRRRGL